MFRKTATDLIFAALSGDLTDKVGRVLRAKKPKKRKAGSPRPLRLAYGRISQESNAFSPVHTTVADFEATHLMEGATLAHAASKEGVETEGFLRQAELSGFVEGAMDEAALTLSPLELVPLISAWTVPSGPLTRECFDTLVGQLVEKVALAHAVAPLDGIFLSLHGAMGVADLPLPAHESPESEILRRLREVVGEAMPIGVTLDLHGNLCRGLVERSTIIQAYQTNPHRDHVAVAVRVARLLIQTIRGEIVPVQRWRSLPLLLGGGNTIDFLPPMRGIFKKMAEWEKHPHVLGTSLFSVHPWNDHPELGWSTLAITDGDAGLADEIADALAHDAWAVRHKKPPVFHGIDVAIERVKKMRWKALGPIVMADLSDVVTAGAPGDNTRILAKMLDEGRDLRAYVPIRDPELVEKLWAEYQPGDVVEVEVGAKLGADQGEPVRLKAEIVSLPESYGVRRMAVLRSGKTHVVVTEGPTFAIKPAFYAQAGLNIRDAEVVVVKNFFPFMLFFFPYSLRTVFVKTEGATDLDAAFALEFSGPVYPRDEVSSWEETDLRRRQLGQASGG